MKIHHYLPLLLLSPLAHAGADCQPVYDAMQKLAITPVREHMQQTADFKQSTSNGEVIITPTAMYVQVDGKWKSTPYDPNKQAQAIAESATTRHTVCTHQPDEKVGAEVADVYATHDVQEAGTTINGKLWISKTRGVPLRQMIDMDVGGKRGKSHTDLRFDYANVQPPVAGQ
ncbi:MAG TPA: hypothetical protein VFN13_14180 [Rudaea sp.]|nr:hypothetical protein [Rudaea sp.]